MEELKLKLNKVEKQLKEKTLECDKLAQILVEKNIDIPDSQVKELSEEASDDEKEDDILKIEVIRDEEKEYKAAVKI